MKLFLIRHGETVDNVAGNLAGVTDSALTVHGVLQTQRLGAHFAQKHSLFSNIFSSDLSRAKRTAQAILDACREQQYVTTSTSTTTPDAAITTTSALDADTPARDIDGITTSTTHIPTLTALPNSNTATSTAQPDTLTNIDNSTASNLALPTLTALPILREQDFGSLEGKPWASKATQSSAPLDISASDFVPSETKPQMDRRANAFVDDYLIPLLAVEPDSNVAVVSHGLLLSRLWKYIVARAAKGRVKVADHVQVGPRGLEHLGAWSNTGYLEVDVGIVAEQEAGRESEGVKMKREASMVDGAPAGALTGDEGMAKDEISPDTQPAQSDETNPNLAEEEPAGPVSPTSPPQAPHNLNSSQAGPRLSIFVHVVNSTAHLVSLKRTRGGIGSGKHDASQGTIDSFFKRKRTK